MLADLMVHYIDVAHWYLGTDHPEKAVTIGDKFTSPQWETPDTAQTLLHYRMSVRKSISNLPS